MSNNCFRFIFRWIFCRLIVSPFSFRITFPTCAFHFCALMISHKGCFSHTMNTVFLCSWNPICPSKPNRSDPSSDPPYPSSRQIKWPPLFWNTVRYFISFGFHLILRCIFAWVRDSLLFMLYRFWKCESVSCSVVSDSMTAWTVAHQTPLSMEFSRQEYCSRLPFPSPGDLPNPRIKPGLLHCRQILYCLSHQGSPTLRIVVFYCLLSWTVPVQYKRKVRNIIMKITRGAA